MNFGKSAKYFVTAALACLSFSGTTAALANEVYIPLIAKGLQHQFWQAVKAGAEQAAKDYGVKVTFEGPEKDSMYEKQIGLLFAALAKRPQALGFAACDSIAAEPLLQKARKMGIPVIAFDSGADSDIPLTTATTNNQAAAAMAADKMAELIGLEGEVAVMVHDQTGRTGIDRRDGFLNRMKSAYPKIKVVSVQYGGGEHQKSAELATQVLKNTPGLKGYFGANEGSAIGVMNAVKQLKREKIVVIGFDSGKQQKDAIASGAMAGAISQNPVGMGYRTVEAAVKALKGEKLPKVIDTGFYFYNKNNMNDPKIAAVLYD